MCIRDRAGGDLGELGEAGAFVGGDHDSFGGSGGGGDDQVVGAAGVPAATGMDQQRRVAGSHLLVVGVDRDHSEYRVEKRALGRPAGVAVCQGAGQVLGHHHRRDSDIVALAELAEVGEVGEVVTLPARRGT